MTPPAPPRGSALIPFLDISTSAAPAQRPQPSRAVPLGQQPARPRRPQALRALRLLDAPQAITDRQLLPRRQPTRIRLITSAPTPGVAAPAGFGVSGLGRYLQRTRPAAGDGSHDRTAPPSPSGSTRPAPEPAALDVPARDVPARVPAGDVPASGGGAAAAVVPGLHGRGVRARSWPRTRAVPLRQQVAAVFSSRVLYEVADELPGPAPVGRRSQFPPYLLLAYGVLARVFRSGARVELELAQPGVWTAVCQLVEQVSAQLPEHLRPEPPPAGPPGWDAYRYARNRHMTSPELLERLRTRFMHAALEQARSAGLLRADGPGSLCHPDRSRTIYGDGTVIRPLYRPMPGRSADVAGTADFDVATAALAEGAADAATPEPGSGGPGGRGGRQDRDADDHYGHTGPVHGQNFVAVSARGDLPHQRIVLAVGRVQQPGREADTAVGLIKQVSAAAGDGLQAIVYDGALRGTHIDDLLRTTGAVVINKVAAQQSRRTGRADKPSRSSRPKHFPLGTWEHATASGPCRHLLAAVGGAVSEVALDDAGKPVVVRALARRQVKRARRRKSGLWHFNVAYELPCPHAPFLVWITPHATAGDSHARRAENIRIIARGEADFDRLYGLRNDAESFNSQLKRTLLVNRAMSLGGQRQLLDVLCYSILNNAVAEAAARSAAAGRAAAQQPAA